MAKRINRGLKPRHSSNYDNEVHGQGDSSVMPGDYTLKENLCRVMTVRPKYNKAKGPLVFRPWPAISYEDPDKLEPGRKSERDRGLSHFIVHVPVASYVGLNDKSCEKATFILHAPWDKSAKAANPFRTLFFAAKQACKDGRFASGKKWDADWNKLMEGGRGEGAQLSGPKWMWMVQGVVFANDDKDYTTDKRELPLGMDPNDDLVVIQLPSSAGDKLVSLYDKRKPEEQLAGVDLEAEPWKAFRYGDPVGLYVPDTGVVTGGSIATVFNPDEIKTITKNTTWDPDRKDKFQSYEAALSKKWRNTSKQIFTPDLDAEQVVNIFNKFQFWFDDQESGQPGLLNIAPPEQQCVWIAKAFSLVPQLLRFAWMDHPEFLSDDVEAILRKRRSAVMPGTGEEGEEEEEQAPRSRSTRRDPSVSGATGQGRDDDDFEDDDFEDDDFEADEDTSADDVDEDFEEDDDEFPGDAEEGEEGEEGEDDAEDGEDDTEEGEDDADAEFDDTEEGEGEDDTEEGEDDAEEGEDDADAEFDDTEEGEGDAEEGEEGEDGEDDTEEGEDDADADEGEEGEEADDDYFGEEEDADAENESAKPASKPSGRPRVEVDPDEAEAEEDERQAKAMEAARERSKRPSSAGSVAPPKPASKPGKPSGKPQGKPANKPADKPAGKPSGKPQGKPADKPADKPSGKPSGKPQGKPSGKPQGKPAGKPQGKPSGKPQGRPQGKPAGKTPGKKPGKK